jgi:hypothetical protein
MRLSLTGGLGKLPKWLNMTGGFYRNFGFQIVMCLYAKEERVGCVTNVVGLYVIFILAQHLKVTLARSADL